MAQTTEKKRIVGNPAKRSGFGSSSNRGASSSKSTRSNVGSIIGFTLGNPGKKGGTVAATKKSTKSKSHASHTGGTKKKKYQSNPGGTRHHKGAAMHKKKYRRNTGSMASLSGLVTTSVFVLVGALGSKLGAQMILGSNNTGIMGYAGNAGVGGALWFLFEKGLKNRTAAIGILAGTFVQIILRAVNDFTPFGSYVANLGMGDYQMQSFVTPQVLVSPWESAEISLPDGWAPRTIAAGPPSSTGSPMPAVVQGGAGGGGGMGSLYSSGGPGGWGGGLYATQ